MDVPKLVWGAADWLTIAAGMAAVLFVLLVAGYWRAGASRSIRIIAGSLKALGIAILLICLLEPLFSGQRARPGANQFVVLADNSQSMTLKDKDAGQSRGEQLKKLSPKLAPWLVQLGRDFDLRQYIFDSQLRPVDSFEELAFDGRASDLGASLERLIKRYQGRALAGVILLTDGSATDAEAVERVVSRASAAGGKMPPIYPVLMGRETSSEDISLERVAVTQTNFEDAPVTLTAQVTTTGQRGQTVVAQLMDEAGKVVEEQKLGVEKEGQPLAARFRVKPEKPGVSFYRVRVAADGKFAQFDHPESTAEATLANNSRMIAVDRGHGPYRVLYVGGRPNWEFKFLQRSLQGDDQVQLVSILRIAKREPKFNFIGRKGDTANPLFRGSDNQVKDQVEQYDQPVLVRLGTQDENELRGGFPKAADELYHYHAIILDDIESEFFTQDQMQLMKEFVRQRGGGLLMLGGQESFKNGKYDRTPLGDLMPVYSDQVPTFPADARHRFSLTREGWLEPWVRLRPEEDAERKRLEAMPAFQTLNAIRGIKPGATVLATAVTENGSPVPALVEQHFGRGRAAALLIGDIWRWGLRRAPNAENDMEKEWRQMIRWLVAEVPQRVELVVQPRREADDMDGTLALGVQVRDAAYKPLDNAGVNIHIIGPDGKSVDMRAEASQQEAGRYESMYVPRLPGAYRAEVAAMAPDGSEVGRAQTGWTSDPAAEEFRVLQPNVQLLDRIARGTGGQVVSAAELERFVGTLPTRHAEITEPYIRPLWHQSWVFLLAIACLAAEWGLRRWNGLP